MARIVGRVALSHGPQLLMPPEQWGRLPQGRDPMPERPELAEHLTPERQQEYYERSLSAMGTLAKQIDEWKPDTIIVIGDDQHENIQDDNTPPVCVFMGDEVDASIRSGESTQAGTKVSHYKVDSALARGLVEGLMELGMDPAWSLKPRLETGMGHAIARPLHFTTPRNDYAIIPLMLNTYYPPAPTPKRCVQLGQLLFQAIEAFPEDRRVVVMGSGGLSHIKIDEDLDRGFINALKTNDLDYMAKMAPAELVAGTSEIRNWIATAAAGTKGGRMVDYVPMYRNAKGIGCAMGFAIWD